MKIIKFLPILLLISIVFNRRQNSLSQNSLQHNSKLFNYKNCRSRPKFKEGLFPSCRVFCKKFQCKMYMVTLDGKGCKCSFINEKPGFTSVHYPIAFKIVKVRETEEKTTNKNIIV